MLGGRRDMLGLAAQGKERQAPPPRTRLAEAGSAARLPLGRCWTFFLTKGKARPVAARGRHGHGAVAYRESNDK